MRKQFMLQTFIKNEFGHLLFYLPMDIRVVCHE